MRSVITKTTEYMVFESSGLRSMLRNAQISQKVPELNDGQIAGGGAQLRCAPPYFHHWVEFSDRVFAVCRVSLQQEAADIHSFSTTVNDLQI